MIRALRTACAIGFMVVACMTNPGVALLAGCGVWMFYEAQKP